MTGPDNLHIGRNTLLLASTMAVFSAVVQLVAAVSSLTFVLVTGIEGLLGLGPAIFLTASALTALPAGRAMDRVGRKPVIALGFLLAAFGCSLTALATQTKSTVAVIAGFALVGAAGAIALLIRTAAGDMYPPERRARGISLVLFGSVFGAILGPAVFSPLFAGSTSRPTPSPFPGSPPAGWRSWRSPSPPTCGQTPSRSRSSSVRRATTRRPGPPPRCERSSGGRA